MKTWQLSALWWIFFINITCGIGLLSLASPMAQETIGMTPTAAASLSWYHRYLQWRGVLHGLLFRLPWTSTNLHTILYYTNHRILRTCRNQ
ncbi:MAG: hypothetical protein ACLRZ2_00720 [Veillonella sp.]